MKLLIVGGTRFLGRHLVDVARARGHAVTLFNRGRSAPPPAGVESLVGDRAGDLAALQSGTWDAAIDTCGYLPRDVARVAAALRPRVGALAFVSTVSVYASSARPNDEDSPLAPLDDPDTTVVDGRSYGPLKAACETEVRRRFGGDALVLRPGLIVGPHDPTQRFSYWPARLGRAADGDTVLAPGHAAAPVQFIDARDLAAFALDALERSHRGVFNAVSPPGHWTFGELLDACAAAAGVSVRFAWVDVAALEALGLAPWSDLPLALPDDDEHRGFMQTDTTRAQAAGLALRPLEATVADTLAWHRSLPAAQQAFDRAGLTPPREAAALGLAPPGA